MQQCSYTKKIDKNLKSRLNRWKMMSYIRNTYLQNRLMTHAGSCLGGGTNTTITMGADSQS